LSTKGQQAPGSRHGFVCSQVQDDRALGLAALSPACRDRACRRHGADARRPPRGLQAVDWTIEPLALAGAIALLAAAPLAQALTLRIALRRLGAHAPHVATLRIWARSFLLRYEPSGAVGFVYRVRERERLGATTPQVLTASGYEQLAAVTAGALVAVLAFAAAGGAPPLLALILAAALAAAAVAVRPALLGDRIVRWLSRRGGSRPAAAWRWSPTGSSGRLRRARWCCSAPSRCR
jgi:hypothetical protein